MLTRQPFILDPTGPIENAIKKKDSDYRCDALLCRGYQFADNEDNIHTVREGDSMNFMVEINAGHRPAYANVSLIDTELNKIITPLKEWPGWPCNTAFPCDDDGALLDDVSTASTVLEWKLTIMQTTSTSRFPRWVKSAQRLVVVRFSGIGMCPRASRLMRAVSIFWLHRWEA